MDQKGVQPVRAEPGQNQQQYNNQGQATAPPAGMSPTYQSQQGAQASSLSLAQVPGQAMGAYPAPLSYQYLQQQQQEQLQAFWMGQRQEIEQVMDFKTHQLPLARIKKIMKADEDVRMIAAEAPVLFAKACEMFILELTLRAWIHTEENKRRTLQKNDIAAAITRTDIFDFLVDIVPRDELKEEGIGFPHPALPVGAPAEPIPYGGVYYMPQQSQVLGGQMPQTQQGGMVPPGVVMGRPAMPMDPALYAQQPRGSFSAYMSPQPGQQPVWQQQQMPPNNNSSGPTSSS